MNMPLDVGQVETDMKFYSDAIALPFRTKRTFHPIIKIRGFENTRRLSIGGVYDRFGHLICNSIRKGGMGGDHVLSQAPLFTDCSSASFQRITGSSIYIGNFMDHYGHFITEGLSRLLDFEVLGQFDNIVMHPFIFNRGRVELRPYHRFFYEKLGVDVAKIRVIEKPMSIESVYIPAQLFTINGEVDQRLRKIYRSIKSNVISRIDGGKFFLSRRPSPLYSRIENLSELEGCFRRHGFRIIYSEDMSVEQQLEIYTGADVIATVSGSGAHNALFFKQDATLIELGDARNSEIPIPMQSLVNSIADCDCTFLKFVPARGKTRCWDAGELDQLVADQI